jgi:hypothetical protein
MPGKRELSPEHSVEGDQVVKRARTQTHETVRFFHLINYQWRPSLHLAEYAFALIPRDGAAVANLARSV